MHILHRDFDDFARSLHELHGVEDTVEPSAM
jgi:hypothetical protein